MYKIFPATLTYDGRKVPVKNFKWKENCTNDYSVISQWSSQYPQLKFYAIPTGTINKILVLDIDVKDDGFSTIKNYHLPLTLSQKTPSGGKHYIFRYPADGNEYRNRNRFDKGLDIRGEGGYIIHYGFDNHPIAEAPEWLLKEALNKKTLENTNNTASSISLDIINKQIEEAYTNICNAPPGESNNILNIESFKIGQLLNSNNLDRNKALQRLFEAAKLRGKPDYEAIATINSGLNGGLSKPITCPFPDIEPILTIPKIYPERWTPSFFTHDDIKNLSKLKKPQIFQNWSTEDFHITTADGGTGKTTLKLYESICLALGIDFLGFKCNGPGRTLFITGEDTKEKIGAMIGMILKQMKLLDNDNIIKQVLNSILVKKESDMCLITKTREGFCYPNISAYNKIMEAVEDIRPKMIVFDPIDFFWGSESALNDMGRAVAKIMGKLQYESKACIEAINHMGKVSSSTKDITQFAGRGGTGLPSHSRVSRVLRPVFEDEYKELTGMDLEENKSAILCNVNKFSDGSPIYNKPFLILRDGFLFSRVAIVEEKIKNEEVKMGDCELIFKFIVEERMNNNYPTKNFIIAYFMENIGKERTKRALDILIYKGFLDKKLKMIENPDPEIKDKCFIITNEKGEEI